MSEEMVCSISGWDTLRNKAGKVRGGPPAMVVTDAEGKVWLGLCATLHVDLGDGVVPFKCLFSKEADVEKGKPAGSAGVVELEHKEGGDVLFEPAPDTIIKLTKTGQDLNVVSTAAVGEAAGKYVAKEPCADAKYTTKFHTGDSKEAMLQFVDESRDPLPLLMTREGAMHIKVAGYDLWFELRGEPGDLAQAIAVVNTVASDASKVKPLTGNIFGIAPKKKQNVSKQTAKPEKAQAKVQEKVQEKAQAKVQEKVQEKAQEKAQEKVTEKTQKETQMTAPAKKPEATPEEKQAAKPRRRTPAEKRQDDIEKAIELLQEEGYTITSGDDSFDAIPQLLRGAADRVDKVSGLLKSFKQVL